MDTEEIAAVVRSVIYKPDWKFIVTWVGDVFVDVTVQWAVRDTSNPPAYEHRLSEPFEYYTSISIGDAADENDIYRQLLEAAISMERASLYHEGREFLRVNEGNFVFRAPFHPHTVEGNQAFEATDMHRLPNNKDLPVT